MTRKDYIRLADDLAIDRRRVEHDEAALAGFELAVDTIAEALKRENARFDLDKFFDAIHQ